MVGDGSHLGKRAFVRRRAERGRRLRPKLIASVEIPWAHFTPPWPKRRRRRREAAEPQSRASWYASSPYEVGSVGSSSRDDALGNAATDSGKSLAAFRECIGLLAEPIRAVGVRIGQHGGSRGGDGCVDRAFLTRIPV